MPQHELDEKSAKGQSNDKKPTAVNAHLAEGAINAELPLEGEGATLGHRHKIAAGFSSMHRNRWSLRLSRRRR